MSIVFPELVGDSASRSAWVSWEEYSANWAPTQVLLSPTTQTCGDTGQKGILGTSGTSIQLCLNVACDGRVPPVTPSPVTHAGSAWC